MSIANIYDMQVRGLYTIYTLVWGIILSNSPNVSRIVISIPLSDYDCTNAEIMDMLPDEHHNMQYWYDVTW